MGIVVIDRPKLLTEAPLSLHCPILFGISDIFFLDKEKLRVKDHCSLTER